MMMTRTIRTTPRTLTTKKSDPATAYSPVQRILSMRHLSYRGITLLAVLLASQLIIFPASFSALDVHASAPTAQHKPSPNDCIFYATVFTNEGRLLEGAEIHVRPTGKKKPDFEAWTDRRGEFAVRVSPGQDYDIEVKAEGFITQMRTANAQTGKQDMVFHMELKPSKKQK
jgi:hypothetical protein